MGFFKQSKKKPGTINEALNHRERVEREKAEQSPEWARAKQKLEELSGPEGQHLAERQRLQAKFERDMRALREKQAQEKSELLQAVSELDPEAAAQAAIQQEQFERHCQVFGKRFVAFMRMLDEYVNSHEITEAECQRAYWKAAFCDPFVQIISTMENYRYEPVE